MAKDNQTNQLKANQEERQTSTSQRKPNKIKSRKYKSSQIKTKPKKMSLKDAIFHEPSAETQAMSMIIGYCAMLISSLAGMIIMIITMGWFWKIVGIIGAIGVILVLGMNVIISYIQLKSIKLVKDPQKALEALFSQLNTSSGEEQINKGLIESNQFKSTQSQPKQIQDLSANPQKVSEEAKEISNTYLNQDGVKDVK